MKKQQHTKNDYSCQYYHMLSSKIKIDSRSVLKNLVILMTSFRDGSNFPVSIEFIVCLLTPKIAASSSWVILFSSL